MDWLSQNWFWVVIFVLFFAMHLFGYGGHGGHGGCSGDEPRRRSGKDEHGADRPQGHQH